jgi:hypothetical protein
MIRMRFPDENALPTDPVIEAYKEGVDRELIRENLRRTVEERIEHMQALVRHAEEAQRMRQREG